METRRGYGGGKLDEEYKSKEQRILERGERCRVKAELDSLVVAKGSWAAETNRKATRVSQHRQSVISAFLKGARSILEHREFEQIAGELFDSCKQLVRAHSGNVFLLSKDGQGQDVLVLESKCRLCRCDHSLPFSLTGILRESRESARAVIANDVSREDPGRYLPQGQLPLDNALVAPLAIDKKVVGLVGLANKLGGFTEEDAQMASSFGELAAIAYLNSPRRNSVGEREERFRSLAQTASDAIITIDSRGEIVFCGTARLNRCLVIPQRRSPEGRFPLSFPSGIARPMKRAWSGCFQRKN